MAETATVSRNRIISARCKGREARHRLCTGNAQIRARARHGVVAGERVVVSLEIPDDIVLSIHGEVARVSEGMVSIQLSGLTGPLAERLLAICRAKLRS